MSCPIKLLSVEDSEDDEVLIIDELNEYGFDVSSKRVASAEDMRAALLSQDWDVITSDHQMPKFNSRGALKVLKESGKDIPFLLVSGSIGELEAVELMRAGAHDYIVKENMKRLGPAVERELREAKNRKARAKADLDLRDALSHLDNLLKAAPAGIAYLDSNLHYVRMNDALAEMNGVSADDSIGKSIFEVVPHLAEITAPLIQQVLREGRSILNKEIQGIIPHSPEKVRSWLMSFYPIRNDKAAGHEVLGVGKVVIDITDRKDIQSRLEDAVRSRDEFLSIASHELRTPLTSLKMQSQLRLRDLDRKGVSMFSEEKLRRMFESDERQMRRLERLIDEMLDISRIRIGKLEILLERIDLCSVVHECAERIKPQVTETGAKVSTEFCAPIWGRWDRHRIEQVCSNLLSNAAKYGDCKPIELKVTRRGSVAQIMVKDFGRGIAREDHERIFGQFERAISVNEVSGLGLGLYIVRKIVEAHDGTITVESDLGQGATFTVSLPIRDTGELNET